MKLKKAVLLSKYMEYPRSLRDKAWASLRYEVLRGEIKNKIKADLFLLIWLKRATMPDVIFRTVWRLAVKKLLRWKRDRIRRNSMRRRRHQNLK